MQVVKAILVLKKIPGLGDVKIYDLIKSVGNVCDLFNYSKTQLLALGLNELQAEALIKPNWRHADEQILHAQKNNIEIISIYDNLYPEILKQIYDPPLILYVKGNSKILTAELFSIVGTRKPTIYGKQIAHHFSEEILVNGYIVTSGFAKGIDICAHLAAINKQQPTVAVLGTSLNYIYPHDHKPYVQKIIDSGGALVSEAMFTTPPNPGCFPRRNRIISGLARGVLVVEAARKSGSLITARCAVEQGREVFAIPGNINNQQALGCLDLIATGAKLTRDVDDIIDELRGIKINRSHQKVSAISDPEKTLPSTSSGFTRSSKAKIMIPRKSQHFATADLFSGDDICTYAQFEAGKKHQKTDSQHACLNSDQQVLLNAISGGLTSFDTIVETCNFSAEVVAAQLLQLEVLGLINGSPGGYAKL